MNKLLTMTCTLIAAAAFTVSAELKLGVVDSERVLAESKSAKTAEDALKKEYAKAEAEATERQKKMQDMKDQLDKQSLLLSAERKKEIESQLQQEMVSYQQFLQQKMGQEGELAKKQEELLAPIIKKVNEIISRIAKNENYDFVFDAKSGIIFAKPAYDITEKVLTQLNTGDAPAAAPAK